MTEIAASTGGGGRLDGAAAPGEATDAAAAAQEDAAATEPEHDHDGARLALSQSIAQAGLHGIGREGQVREASQASGLERAEAPEVPESCGAELAFEAARWADAADRVESLAELIANTGASSKERLKAAEQLLAQASAFLGGVADDLERPEPAA